MHIQSFSVNNAAEFTEALSAAPVPGRPYTLAILFGASQQEIGAYQLACREAGVALCGCSTAGEIYDGELHTERATGLLFDLPREAFEVFYSEHPDALVRARTLGAFVAGAFAGGEVFMLSGGLNVDGEAFVRDTFESVGKPFKLFGGMAADDLTHAGTSCFSESGIADPGTVAVVFDGSVVELRCDTTSGWRAVGIEHRVTKSTGNLLQEIDGEPALPFFRRFLGEVGNPRFSGTDVSTAIAQYPLEVVRAEGKVLRAPAGALEEEQAMRMSGAIHAGDRFRFSIAPGFEVIDQTVAYFRERLLGRAVPEATIVVSCKGRHASLGPMLEDEIELIHEAFGGVASAGYLSYGEIGSTGGGASTLHNETCCVISIRSRATATATATAN